MGDRSFIEALRDTWTATSALCADLDEAEWAKPTECPGWSVRDQVAHLIGTESGLLRRPSPPPAPSGRPHVRNPIGELNEAWVEAYRDRPGREVLADFDEVTSARLAALAAMTDEELGEQGPSPIGIVPYAVFMDVRVMDCWVHEQDIRRAVDRRGHLDGPAAARSLDRLGSSLGFVVGKRVAPPEGTTVVLDVGGPLARRLAVGVRSGRAVPATDVAQPTITLSLDEETFVRLVTGRTTGEAALAAGEVSMAGDDALGRRVLDNLATIP